MCQRKLRSVLILLDIDLSVPGYWLVVVPQPLLSVVSVFPNSLESVRGLIEACAEVVALVGGIPASVLYLVSKHMKGGSHGVHAGLELVDFREIERSFWKGVCQTVLVHVHSQLGKILRDCVWFLR
jgi:hypothetical protein